MSTVCCALSLSVVAIARGRVVSTLGCSRKHRFQCLIELIVEPLIGLLGGPRNRVLASKIAMTIKNTLDFIVIGAQKAGTTSLFEYLKRNPELSLPVDKEAPYFSHDDVYARGWDNYMKRTFAFADPAQKWGTVTPQYMVGGVYGAMITPGLEGDGYDERTVPLRIRERLPDVRLIAVLRDPVERARSHHRMALMNGFERRSFDEAIEDLLNPEALERSRRHPDLNTGYVAWGEYGRILAEYFDIFSREQILVLFTDELARTPERFLGRVHEFLGVKPDFIPDNLGTRYRVGGVKRRFSWLSPSEGSWPSPHGAIKRAITNNPATHALWRALPEIGRQRIDRGLARTIYRLDLWNQRSGTNLDDPTPATLAKLQEHFAKDADELAVLLVEAPPWQMPAGAA
jgi:hypothetical protein